jgi:hypothetical protein
VQLLGLDKVLRFGDKDFAIKVWLLTGIWKSISCILRRIRSWRQLVLENQPNNAHRKEAGNSSSQ